MRASVLFLALLAFGCSPASTAPIANGPGEDLDRIEPLPLDLAAVKEELKKNRPATLNKYVGKLVEVRFEGSGIRGGNVSHLQLGFSPANIPGQAHPEISYLGHFSFSDPRNSDMKKYEPGRFVGTVRGKIDRFAFDARLGDWDLIVLDPAWLVGGLEAFPGPKK